MSSGNSENSVVILLEENKALANNDSQNQVVYECCHRLSRRLITLNSLSVFILLVPLAYILDGEEGRRHSLSVLSSGTSNVEANFEEGMSHKDVEEEVVKKYEISLFRVDISNSLA